MNRHSHTHRRSGLGIRVAGIAAVTAVAGAVMWKTSYMPPVAETKHVDRSPTIDASPVTEPIYESDSPDLLSATQVSLESEPQRIYLISTSPGPTPRQGMARIGTNLRAPQTYAAGAILLNGAKLAEIHHRFVVLERDGERLRLPIARSKADSLLSELAFVGGEPPEGAPLRLADDRLSEIIRLSPVYENNLLVGMQIYPGRRNDIFSNLGLHPGDMVVAVEGSPIADPGGMDQLFQPLLDGISMTLAIQREAVTESHVLDAGVVSRSLEQTPYAVQLK